MLGEVLQRRQEKGAAGCAGVCSVNVFNAMNKSANYSSLS